MAQPCRLVKQAASRAQASLPVGFDPFTILAIISAVLPFLKDCFAPPSPGATRKYVKDHYTGGQYGNQVLNRTTAQVFKAWREDGKKIKRKRDRAQAETIAVATLDEIRLADDATLAEAMQS